MNDTTYKDSIGSYDTIDNYSSVVGTIGGVTGITTTNATTNTVWINPISNGNSEPVNEGDIFKQIVSLLGIKIANVAIDNGTITIYGFRRKKKYIIEITGYSVTVRNEKGKLISEILLQNYIDTPTITINTPYVYPAPNTNINPTWTYPPITTTAGDTYTITAINAADGTYTLDRPIEANNV
jgi:hypothetical protein